MLVPVYAAGALGLNIDIPDHELPPEAISLGRNFRMVNGEHVRVGGTKSVYPGLLFAPYHILDVPIPANNTHYWLYMGLKRAACIIAGVHTDVTRAAGASPYTGDAEDLWSSTLLQGIPVLTNGIDLPQMWLTPGSGTDLADLTNWPASTYCRVIRSFKSFLMAFYVTEGANVYPSMIRWSTSADPGAVPGSWDYTSTSNEAGRTVLAEAGGAIVDAQQLRDLMAIYRENSIWVAEPIGGTFVFRFRGVSETAGLFSPRCVGVVKDGDWHFAAIQEDFVVFNGQTVESIAHRRVRRLFASIDTTNYRKSFVVVNRRLNEAMFCFPEAGSACPNVAAVWNWRENVWSMRDLQCPTHINQGIVETSVSTPTWDTSTLTWDEQIGDWDSSNFNPAVRDLLVARVDPESVLLNGDFAASDGWTAGSGWAIAAGKATGTLTSADLSQTYAFEEGEEYEVTFTVSNRTAGTVQPRIGTAAGTARNADGTYTEVITVPVGGGDFILRGAGFSGDVDNVTVTHVNLLKMDEGYDNDGDTYETVIERSGLALIGRARDGSPKVDFLVRKLCVELWIHATGDTFYVQMGGSERQGVGYTWTAPKAFNPNTDRKLDFTVGGKFLAVRFRGSGSLFKIQGFDFELAQTGRY